MHVDDIRLELTLWDFGGEDKYRNLFPSYVNGCIAALILYDTTRKETIEDIQNWVNIIDQNQDGVIKVLIGTKIDLVDQREISKEDADKACNEYNWCADIIETSSKTGENVEQAFVNVVREVIKRKLNKCQDCGEFFSKSLKFCSHCGAAVSKVTFS